MKLVNMAMSKEDAKKEYPSTMMCGEESDNDLPKYPYGLTVCLCDEEMAKLGITDLPKVGEKMTLNAVVEVIGVSKTQRQGIADSEVRLQITDMALSGAPEQTRAQTLYKGMNP